MLTTVFLFYTARQYAHYSISLLHGAAVCSLFLFYRVRQYAHYFLLQGAAVCSIFLFYRVRQYAHYFLLQGAEVCSLFSSTGCGSMLTIFFYKMRKYMLPTFFYIVRQYAHYFSQYAHYSLLQGAAIGLLFLFYRVPHYARNFYSTRNGIFLAYLTRYPRFILF